MLRERESRDYFWKLEKRPENLFCCFIVLNVVICPSGTNHWEGMEMTLPLEHSETGNEVRFPIWATWRRRKRYFVEENQDTLREEEV